MAEIKLKPCPFCGNTNIYETNCRELEECAHFEECDTDIMYFAYVCSVNHGGCGAATGYYEHEEEAIEAWNRRNNEIKTSTWDEDAKNKIKSTSWSVKAEEG